jgi:acetyl esterase/lipase
VPVLKVPHGGMPSRRKVARLLLGSAAALAAGCSDLGFTIANLPARRGPFERLAGIAYGRDARQTLDLYRPAGVRDAPVVVFWYGGAWVKGRKEDYRFVGAALAAAGCVALLPDYRLYPAARFPAFIEDGARATAWAIRHAREHGGDPGRVFLAGHSAGAHLAAMLAVQPRWLGQAGADPAAVRGLIGLSGPYALQPNTPTLNAIFAPPFTAADWRPAEAVKPGAPRSLLLHGAADDIVWPSQSESFAAALRAAGVPVELEIYPRRGHADTVAALSAPARARAPVLAAIQRFVDTTPA